MDSSSLSGPSLRSESLWAGIEGIVFDAVGTLIEPRPTVAEAYAAAAARQGVYLERTILRERFLQAFGDDEVDEAGGAMATSEAIEVRRWRRIVANVLLEVPDVEAAFGELWEHFGNSACWACFPDVEATIERIAARRIPMCIGSNFDGRLRAVVAGLEALAPLRESLVISSEAGFRKPHPAFFERVVAHLGLPAERILCVGDDFTNDVEGATQAGMRAVFLDRRGRGVRGDVAKVASLAELTSHWG